ncbi:uncharacterized protein LOC116001860 [Ipomoea triloba]|uniref:uncharacterized protein LOC116001860 n=1 Tax=Ipomoea triloba TaxID=35885 RepID=UPI00125DB49B|nr:uncharacterized protein LOC116001860 [Ipomoea triloba]
MVRKNQDEKKLKLNQPILSVRRSGKDDKRKIDDSSSLHSVPQAALYRSESKLDPVRSPGVVPFVWEESPGKPKDGAKLQNDTTGRPRVVPRLPHGRIMAKTNQQCFDSEISEDEAYAESSKSKVFFVDCKSGSFKGSDEPDRTSSETRDFMIGLFLPGAKTMASETPIYVPGKQSVVHELPRPRKNVAKADRPPRLQLEPSGGWHCYQSHDCEDDEHKHETLFPAKACGVVPRLCVRSSIFILNPVPAMSVKTRVHTSPGSRMQRYSFARSCTGLNDEIIFSQRPMSGLTKQKSVANAHSELPQTHEMKAVLPTQGLRANPRLDSLRSCKKFSRKLQELLADHSGSMREDSCCRVESPVRGSDSPVTKMKPQHKPILDFSFRDKTKPFVQETVEFDLLTSDYEFSAKSGRKADKRYELTITALDSDSEEEDERSIKQEALTRKLKQSQEMMHLEVPESPPLPNTPSDSWLFRTLPSLSIKTSPLRPCLSENPRDPSSEVQSGDPHC